MWVVEALGEKFSERELTIGHYIKLEDELGLSWRQISPLTSAKAARAILALLYAERRTLAVEHARAEIERIGAYDFLDEFTFEAGDSEPDPQPANQ